ncbi:ABC transporter substrate-binding protein [Hyphomonas johnsonii]|uniref:Toluene tolerance family protein n=1 Tax=Hyphomonas johnsonii MHS-2 TaxID=1280950 RepID=A0A059FCQ2_9PROT|nr:ABC transporter substrate-binding protein [Hyphomonas johnsonii]KCZ88377.1 toluene tolerance family protein [Hyphomonas johnsonii MHS-2]
MLRAVFVSTALVLFTLSAQASPEAEAVIASAATQISGAEAGDQAITESVDIEAIARFTLGKYSRQISDADKVRFTEAFEDFLVGTFREQKNKLRNASVEVIGSIDRNDRDSVVETRVTQKGEEPQTVRWRVIQRDGAWRVVDVEVLGLWLAIEQRAQIAAILDKPRATIDDAIAALNS